MILERWSRLSWIGRNTTFMWIVFFIKNSKWKEQNPLRSSQLQLLLSVLVFPVKRLGLVLFPQKYSDECLASAATCHLESTKQSTRGKWETNYQPNVFIVMKLWQHSLHWSKVKCRNWAEKHSLHQLIWISLQDEPERTKFLSLVAWVQSHKMGEF